MRSRGAGLGLPAAIPTLGLFSSHHSQRKPALDGVCDSPPERVLLQWTPALADVRSDHGSLSIYITPNVPSPSRAKLPRPSGTDEVVIWLVRTPYHRLIRYQPRKDGRCPWPLIMANTADMLPCTTRPKDQHTTPLSNSSKSRRRSRLGGHMDKMKSTTTILRSCFPQSTCSK